VLTEVSQRLRRPCLPLLRSMMLLYHFPNPAGAVESLQEVIVSLLLQRLPVKVALREVRHLSDLGIDGIGNVAREIIDLKDEIRLVLRGELLGGDLSGFL
jgi:hypothetical protein